MDLGGNETRPETASWARAQLVRGDSDGLVWSIDSTQLEAKLTVGSSPQSGWPVRAMGVAATHIELFWDGASLWVCDVTETGILVNGIVVRNWTQLRGQVDIEFGTAALHVQCSDPDTSEMRADPTNAKHVRVTRVGVETPDPFAVHRAATQMLGANHAPGWGDIPADRIHVHATMPLRHASVPAPKLATESTRIVANPTAPPEIRPRLGALPVATPNLVSSPPSVVIDPSISEPSPSLPQAPPTIEPLRIPPLEMPPGIAAAIPKNDVAQPPSAAPNSRFVMPTADPPRAVPHPIGSKVAALSSLAALKALLPKKKPSDPASKPAEAPNRTRILLMATTATVLLAYVMLPDQAPQDPPPVSGSAVAEEPPAAEASAAQPAERPNPVANHEPAVGALALPAPPPDLESPSIAASSTRGADPAAPPSPESVQARRAVDYVITGHYREATQAYRQLAAQHPGRREYALMVTILEAKLERNCLEPPCRATASPR